jgi:hypothetical protein
MGGIEEREFVLFGSRACKEFGEHGFEIGYRSLARLERAVWRGGNGGDAGVGNVEEADVEEDMAQFL